jgi:hypothetical protein
MGVQFGGGMMTLPVPYLGPQSQGGRAMSARVCAASLFSLTVRWRELEHESFLP